MKLTAIALLALSAPSVAFGLVGNNWNFKKAPQDGLNDITFPFNMAKAPRVAGYYFAQQFNFHNVKEVGYTGLQPIPNATNKQMVHAVFSSFQGGTTSRHKNCSDGADGGAGVSCKVEVQGNYKHNYQMEIKRIGGTTWRGTLIDTVTKKSVVVGEWTLPAGAGKLVDSQVGFVEYYPWNAFPTPPACSTLPKTEAIFYNPTTKTKGASGGQVSSVYEYGNCIGKAGFKLKKVANGFDIKVGF